MWTALGLTLVLAVFLAPIDTQPLIQEEPSGVLEIGGVQASVDIPTRVGCREVIRCLGNGSRDSLQWNIFGLRSALQTMGNIIVDIMHDMDPDGDNSFAHIGHLVFDPVTLRDSNSFICSVSSTQGLYSANVIVQPELADITAVDHDLSVRFVGDNMSIPCTVESCVPDLVIQLMRGNAILETMTIQQAASQEFMPMENIFVLTVSPDLVGQYTCRVLGSFMDEPFSINQHFNITGTPQPRPTQAVRVPRPTESSALCTSLSTTLVAALVLLPMLLL